MPDQIEVRQPSYLERFIAFQLRESFAGIDQLLNHRGVVCGRVCDLMSGTGLVARHIAKRSPRASVVCVDRAPKMLQAVPDGFEVREGDVRDLDGVIHPGEFDLIVCRAGFNNLEERDYPTAISSLASVMGAGSHLLVQDHFPNRADVAAVWNQVEQWMARFEGRDDVPFFPTASGFESMLASAGFSVCDERAFSVDIPFRARLEMKDMYPDAVTRGISELRALLEAQDVVNWRAVGEEVLVECPISSLLFERV